MQKLKGSHENASCLTLQGNAELVQKYKIVKQLYNCPHQSFSLSVELLAAYTFKEVKGLFNQSSLREVKFTKDTMCQGTGKIGSIVWCMETLVYFGKLSLKDGDYFGLLVTSISVSVGSEFECFIGGLNISSLVPKIESCLLPFRQYLCAVRLSSFQLDLLAED